MIEKVKGLSICGRCFSKKTNLAFFPNDNDRIAIVYGKNGSGKSTISDGFSQIASGEDAEELSASAVTRGIDNPAQRTSFIQLKVHAKDWMVLCFFLVAFVVLFFCKYQIYGRI